MNNFKYPIYSLLMVFLLLLSSCNLSEINNNPNQPEVVPTTSILLSVQKQIVDNIRNENTSLRGSVLFSQYFSQLSYTAQSRYDIPLSSSDQYWDNAYLALNNLNQIIIYNSQSSTRQLALLGGRNNTQIAISRVLKAFVFHSLTDVFGAVPYQSFGTKDPQFEALQQNPDNYTPVYAPQEKIYLDILKELQAAADTLMKYKTENTFGVADIIYKGSNLKWAKLANSLRLRLSTRIQAKLPAIAQQHFNDALIKGVFESNQDNAIFKYAATAPNQAPLYKATVAASRKDFAVSSTLIGVLEGRLGPFGIVDPRLPVYALPGVKSNTYVGVPYGLDQVPAGVFRADTASLPGSLINAPDFAEVIMEYAEVAFLISENKNWDDAYYRKGVQASLDRWGVSAVESSVYLGALATANKENVLTQKYLALYMQGIEAWSEIRRTSYPLFIVKPGDVIWQNKGVTYTFQPLFGSGMPKRLRYPSKEQSVNRKNYQQALSIQGIDAIDTPIWWQ